MSVKPIQIEKRAGAYSIAPRVIIVTAHWPEVTGGVSRTLHYWMNSCKSCADPPTFRIVQTRGSGALLWSAFYTLRAILIIIHQIATEKVDLVHINICANGSTIRKLMIAAIALVFRTPYMLHIHAGLYAKYFDSRSRLGQSIIRYFFKRAKRVIVLGTVWRDFVCDRIGVDRDRTVILRNAVPAPKIVERWPSPGRCTILFLGWLTKTKGVPELLRALSSDQVRALEWNAVLAGDGDVKGYKKRAADLGLAGRVRFPGWVDPDSVSRFLEASDVLVLPSHHEGLPNSVLEGMSFGLAVVSTTVGAIPEVIEHGTSGLLVPPADADALANALCKVIEDSELRASLARAGQERFLEQFEIGVYAQRMDDLYRQCLVERE